MPNRRRNYQLLVGRRDGSVSLISLDPDVTYTEEESLLLADFIIRATKAVAEAENGFDVYRREK